MSSKLNFKASKKDRPKSSDKLKKTRRDGTPEKSMTPSQDALLDDNRPPSRNFIWNEEIEKLAIKDEDLQKIREPRPPSGDKQPPTLQNVIVKKAKPVLESEKPKAKTVTIAKPAPSDAAVKPIDYTGYAGPRYTEEGHVIPHSILGSYEDFHREAVQRGDLLEFPSGDSDHQPKAPTLKYEKKKRPPSREFRTRSDQNNALVNWQYRMLERKRQQGYISKLLQKAPEDLVMNQSDNYRKMQEDRYLIDRTIPAVDYGKGYRVGSEFWQQQERFGDELSGVHMTLTQTEKGYPPPFERVGIPNVVKNEKGVHWSPNHSAPIHYPWHKAPYLAKRTKQLQKIMDELDPNRPEYDELQVIGTNKPHKKSDDIDSDDDLTEMGEGEGKYDMDNKSENLDPLRDHPDVHPEPIFGPSLEFAGQPARWTGDGHCFRDQIGIEARVTFETFSGDRVTSFLEVTNDGTTAMYYDWKKLQRNNPFDLVHANVQRFYFNNSNGVILPGETVRVPFVFKSPNAGVFTEQWFFETRPVLCGGAALVVTLRGIAIQEDKFKGERQQLEQELAQKQAEQVVRQLMDDLLSGIQTPDRVRSPVDAYITDEEIFARLNPGLHYRHDMVSEMKQMYIALFPDQEDQAELIWDLSIADLKGLIMELDDSDERKESFLQRINNAVSQLTFSPSLPQQKSLHKVGYQLLVEAVDHMVGESMLLRHIIGLPSRDNEELPDDFTQGRTSSKSEKESDAKKGKGSDKDKKDSKDKKAGAGKGAKAKEQSKLDTKGKTTPSAKKTPGSRAMTSASTPGKDGLERERSSSSPASGPHTPTLTDADPILEAKYRDKLYAQTHVILGNMFDKMDEAFRAVMSSEGGGGNPRLH